MFKIKADEELKTTVYEKEGFDSLDDYFKVILEAKKAGNDDVVKASFSKLNDEEKEEFIDWAKSASEFPELVKIMLKASLNKFSIDVNREVYNKIAMFLMANGFSLIGELCKDDECGTPFSVEFTDGELINGYVDYSFKKVHLTARDAYDKMYEKTIDYLDASDLLKSINHFQKDIRETFEEKAKKEVSGDWSDILGDKDFLASIDAEDILNQK